MEVRSLQEILATSPPILDAINSGSLPPHLTETAIRGAWILQCDDCLRYVHPSHIKMCNGRRCKYLNYPTRTQVCRTCVTKHRRTLYCPAKKTSFTSPYRCQSCAWYLKTGTYVCRSACGPEFGAAECILPMKEHAYKQGVDCDISSTCKPFISPAK